MHNGIAMLQRILHFVPIFDGRVWYDKQSPKVALERNVWVVSQAVSKLNQDCVEAAHIGCPKRVIIIAACTSVSVLEREK